METPVGRFAPTPSGRMHLGNILCALCAWASIRQKKGRFLLRIEDLDTTRYRDPNCIAQIKDDLAWLGITYDNECTPNTYQSARTPIYEEQLRRLEKNTILFPCYCSRDQLHAATAPHTEDGQPLYSGDCLRYLGGTVRPPTKKPSLRIHVPNSEIVFTDHLQGLYQQNLKNECGDFILRRADGIFSYQFAVIIDDGLSKVSEVVRGSDLLSSTPRQIWLLRQLGFSVPNYYHIPLLCDHEGNRLAKRNGGMDMSYLRKKYPNPEEVIGILSFAIGLTSQWEPLSAPDFLSLFCWEKLKKERLCLPKQFCFDSNTL